MFDLYMITSNYLNQNSYYNYKQTLYSIYSLATSSKTFVVQ